MPCYKPLSAWVCDEPNASGKCSLTWDIKKTARPDNIVQVPCGQCIGCLLERSRSWAVRCVHEASLYDRNCFITLTYRPERLPPNGSLCKRHFQLFMKRLRKKFGKVRYFQCGEYGDDYQRPHYHACLFGFDFDDKLLLSKRDGVETFVSDALVDLWIDFDGVELPKPDNWLGHYNPLSMGFSTVGSVTFESAAYVARYVSKKLDKLSGEYRYREMVSPDRGDRIPEYVAMSRRPGIGSSWFDKFRDDVYPDDFVVVRNGVICKPPKFYDVLLDRNDPDLLKQIKTGRKEVAENNPNNSWKRLAVRHKVKLLKAQKLRRVYEEKSV